MKFKKTTTVITTEIREYEIHSNVILLERYENDTLIIRKLCKNPNNPDIKKYDKYRAIYGPDLEYLKKSNPFWFYDRDNREYDSDWLNGMPIPENPEDIDLSKVVFLSWYDHTFRNFNFEPIPVVVWGDYIGENIRSGCYDLEALHDHLAAHPQVVEISDIEEIPYYNNPSGEETCFEVLVLPTFEQLKVLKKAKDIFYSPHGNTDFLDMGRFYIGGSDEMGYS